MTEEQTWAIGQVLDYVLENERTHYLENGRPHDHIYQRALEAAPAFNRHVPKFCMLDGCDNEAVRWFEDSNFQDNTFYVCMEHKASEKAEEEGTVKNTRGQIVDFGFYSCSEDCEECEN